MVSMINQSPLRLVTIPRISTFATSIKHCTEGPSKCYDIRGRKEGNQTGKEN